MHRLKAQNLCKKQGSESCAVEILKKKKKKHDTVTSYKSPGLRGSRIVSAGLDKTFNSVE